MSKRFGRNQKRRLREEIKKLSHSKKVDKEIINTLSGKVGEFKQKERKFLQLDFENPMRSRRYGLDYIVRLHVQPPPFAYDIVIDPDEIKYARHNVLLGVFHKLKQGVFEAFEKEYTYLFDKERVRVEAEIKRSFR